jgi:hypothetical protein
MRESHIYKKLECFKLKLECNQYLNIVIGETTFFKHLLNIIVCSSENLQKYLFDTFAVMFIFDVRFFSEDKIHFYLSKLQMGKFSSTRWTSKLNCYLGLVTSTMLVGDECQQNDDDTWSNLKASSADFVVRNVAARRNRIIYGIPNDIDKYSLPFNNNANESYGLRNGYIKYGHGMNYNLPYMNLYSSFYEGRVLNYEPIMGLTKKMIGKPKVKSNIYCRRYFDVCFYDDIMHLFEWELCVYLTKMIFQNEVLSVETINRDTKSTMAEWIMMNINVNYMCSGRPDRYGIIEYHKLRECLYMTPTGTKDQYVWNRKFRKNIS